MLFALLAALQQPADASQGTIMIRDLLTRDTIAHFKAHSEPIAALRFAPGGRLLASAAESGLAVKIFAIPGPAKEPREGVAASPAPPQLLYTLQRGATPAVITNISFSSDAQWVAVGSGRGTAHVFRLPHSVLGGATGQETSLQSAGGAVKANSTAVNASGGGPVALTSVARIHRQSVLPVAPALGAAVSALQSVYTQAAVLEPLALGFVRAAVAQGAGSKGDGSCPGSGPHVRLCVATGDGMMRLFSLKAPGTSADDETSPTGGSASSARHGNAALEPPPAGVVECESWDICRHAGWPEKEEVVEVEGGGQEGQRLGSIGGESAVWAAWSEAAVHSAPRVVWGGSQFRVGGSVK